jgi:hypothetical protein
MDKHILKFDISLQTEKEAGNYNGTCIFSFQSKESCPEGEDPVIYAKKRIAEELNRHASKATINWQNEDKADETDPLTGEPF